MLDGAAIARNSEGCTSKKKRGKRHQAAKVTATKWWGGGVDSISHDDPE